jgi:hypothetical protein
MSTRPATKHNPKSKWSASLLINLKGLSQSEWDAKLVKAKTLRVKFETGWIMASKIYCTLTVRAPDYKTAKSLLEECAKAMGEAFEPEELKRIIGPRWWEQMERAKLARKHGVTV